MAKASLVKAMVKMAYEATLIKSMIQYDITLLEALMIDMQENAVDTENVFDLTDYLEEMFDQNMDKVAYYMEIITGSQPDMYLKPT
jgi:hypothetical protein